MAASIADISGGRFILGLGAGWNEPEFRAFGFPFDHRVARFEEAFEIIRRLLAGETVSYNARFHQVDAAVLLPPAAHRVPLMVGSMGERMLSITLPHVDAWNTWYSWYGNRPEGFAKLNATIDDACGRVDRDPKTLQRTACVLVAFGSAALERRHDAEPVEPARLREHVDALHDAGADEVILVLDPITEASIRQTGDLLQRAPAARSV
jgi:alkanesulfonate monooxygenase SsuD/methylene tetrahydromethanopterin reductase-like flavin-dependent oxidoreductase (luciferase family)